MEYHKIEKLTEIQVAYFAGLLDGEGCVRIGKFRNSSGVTRYRAYIVIAMTDVRPINWLVNTIGGKKYIDKKKRFGNSKICFCWTLNAKEGSTILRRTLPYLLVKSEQSRNFIAFAETLTGRGGRGINKPISQSLLKTRAQMFLVSQSLNQKGKTT